MIVTTLIRCPRARLTFFSMTTKPCASSDGPKSCMFLINKLLHDVLRMRAGSSSPLNLSGFFVFSVEIQGLSRMRTNAKPFVRCNWRAKNSGYEGAIFSP